MKNNKFYYKIDVISSENGYSFMFSSDYHFNSDDEVINIALENNLFDCYSDADNAVVDSLISDYDIEHFLSYGCVYEV